VHSLRCFAADSSVAEFRIQAAWRNRVERRFTMRRAILTLGICAVLMVASATFAWSDDREDEAKRVQAAADVLNDIMAAPDKGIPQEIMDSAVCVGVVPSLKKGGFIFGAEYGKGVASCHNSNGWSAPAPFTVAGGSWGLQIGGEAVDLVMVVMNDKGMQSLLSSKFKLGADASAAAGPVGRHVEGETDWKMKAEVLTYSRARGLFAGLTLNGAVIEQDKDATRAFYGDNASFRSILQGSVAAPSGSEPFLTAMRKFDAEAQTAKVNRQ
jgi:lipid-binding SYLF domain-containing protein